MRGLWRRVAEVARDVIAEADRLGREFVHRLTLPRGPVCYACGVDLRAAAQDRAFVGYVDALARVPRPERATAERYHPRDWSLR